MVTEISPAARTVVHRAIRSLPEGGVLRSRGRKTEAAKLLGLWPRFSLPPTSGRE